MKKYLDDNPEKLQAWIKWRNDFWTPERIKELNTGGRGTVSVTDSDGNSKRISREYYATMARPTDMTKWEYVPVAAKESKRRKNLKISP